MDSYFIGPFVSDPRSAGSLCPRPWRRAKDDSVGWSGHRARDHGQLKIPLDLGKIHTIISLLWFTNYNFTENPHYL